MTSDPLLVRSKKQLADMARKKGIANWRDLRKEELVKALRKTRAKLAARSTMKPSVNGRHSTNGKAAKPHVRPPASAARDTASGSGGITAERTG